MREWIQRTKWRVRMGVYEWRTGVLAWWMVFRTHCDDCRLGLKDKAFLNVDKKLKHLEARQTLDGGDVCRVEAGDYFHVVRNVKIYMAGERFVPETKAVPVRPLLKSALDAVRRDHLATMLAKA